MAGAGLSLAMLLLLVSATSSTREPSAGILDFSITRRSMWRQGSRRRTKQIASTRGLSEDASTSDEVGVIQLAKHRATQGIGGRRASSTALLGHWDPGVRAAAWKLRTAAQELVAAEASGEPEAAEHATASLGAAEALLRGLRSQHANRDSTDALGSDAMTEEASSLLSIGASKAAPPPSGSISILDRSDSEANATRESIGWLDPVPADLNDVQAWVEELAAAAGEDSQLYNTKLRQQPGNAIPLLMSLVEHARNENDGIDRDAQAMYHLLELQLEKRRAGSTLKLTQALIGELAGDFRRLALLRTLPLGALLTEVHNGTSSPQAGSPEDLITTYFQGLAMRKASNTQDAQQQSQPRVLVFSCSYGDGHRSAARAVASYLEEDQFVLQTVDTTEDPRLRSGIAAALGIDVGALYNNVILKRQWYRLHNLYDMLAGLAFGQVAKPCPAPTCNTDQKNRFREIMLAVRPDLVVTVYHMDLLPILEVAKDLGNLPVLHIATDMDTKMAEVFGRSGPAAIYPRFRVAVPFANDMSQRTVRPLDPAFSFVSGYPVRSAFLEPQLAGDVALGTSAPTGAKVVLVMSGGGGQALPWPERLAAEGIGHPLHLVVVVGRNTEEGARLLSAFPAAIQQDGSRLFAEEERHNVRRGKDPNVTLEVAVDPTNDDDGVPYYIRAALLARLMDQADAIITKAGGGTSAEIAYRGLPALFDASEGLLHWEDFTVQVFEKEGRGQRFTSLAGLQSGLLEALQDGRSTKLAADPRRPGQILNTAENIRKAAASLMRERDCVKCTVFA